MGVKADWDDVKFVESDYPIDTKVKYIVGKALSDNKSNFGYSKKELQDKTWSSFKKGEIA